MLGTIKPLRKEAYEEYEKDVEIVGREEAYKKYQKSIDEIIKIEKLEQLLESASILKKDYGLNLLEITPDPKKDIGVSVKLRDIFQAKKKSIEHEDIEVIKKLLASIDQTQTKKQIIKDVANISGTFIVVLLKHYKKAGSDIQKNDVISAGNSFAVANEVIDLYPKNFIVTDTLKVTFEKQEYQINMNKLIMKIKEDSEKLKGNENSKAEENSHIAKVESANLQKIANGIEEFFENAKVKQPKSYNPQGIWKEKSLTNLTL